MTEYIKAADGSLVLKGAGNSAVPVLTIVSAGEFKERQDLPYHREITHILGSIRYCKAEWFPGYLIGALRIPAKNLQSTPQFTFAVHLTQETVVFIENSGDLKRWMEKHLPFFAGAQSTLELFLKVLEQLIEEDLLYLYHLEKEIEDLESLILENIPKDIFIKLTDYRRKLSELNAYYAQMAAVGERIPEDSSCADTARAWERYSRHAERLQSHVGLLRENILRLRELISSVQAERQNRIMSILTVVTTLFLPLTLLTGWYGMNFSGMPELGWKYGYPLVIILAVVIIILEIIWFKKKRFF